MHVLVIGSGGREHALGFALARSKDAGKLFFLPGNAGTERLGTNVPGHADDIDLALAVARRESIGLTVVGPEAPLAAGVVDAFERVLDAARQPDAPQGPQATDDANAIARR